MHISFASFWWGWATESLLLLSILQTGPWILDSLSLYINIKHQNTFLLSNWACIKGPLGFSYLLERCGNKYLECSIQRWAGNFKIATKFTFSPHFRWPCQHKPESKGFISSSGLEKVTGLCFSYFSFTDSYFNSYTQEWTHGAAKNHNRSCMSHERVICIHSSSALLILSTIKIESKSENILLSRAHKLPSHIIMWLIHKQNIWGLLATVNH